jgi:hypothetical protein
MKLVNSVDLISTYENEQNLNAGCRNAFYFTKSLEKINRETRNSWEIALEISCIFMNHIISGYRSSRWQHTERIKGDIRLKGVFVLQPRTEGLLAYS